MLRFNKEELRASSEKLHKDRLIEKAISKFTRKLELMVDSKLPREHIMSAAAQYGLEVTDLTAKIVDYLNANKAKESAHKTKKSAQTKTETAKEVKVESEQTPEQKEPS